MPVEPVPVARTAGAITFDGMTVGQVTAAIRGVVTRALGPCHVVMGPFAYATSHPLFDVVATPVDAPPRHLIAKVLGRFCLNDDARLAKPMDSYDPDREPQVLAHLLSGTGLGAPDLVGTAHLAGGRVVVQVVNRLPGVPLTEVGSVSVWCATAEWLGRLHARFADPDVRALPILLDYDARRLRAAAQPGIDRLVRSGARCGDRLAAVHDRAVRSLAALPATLVHGDFFAPNVIVDAGAGPTQVGAVDWETAGRGPGVLDLAALVSGSWASAERTAMIDAYDASLDEGPVRAAPTGVALHAVVDQAALQVALTWAGADPAWSPPVERDSDWVSAVGETVDRLEGTLR
jgi:aminoglycoside phosphotransferase